MTAYRTTRVALLGAALACFAAAPAAQEKTRISFNAPASMTKYVAQHWLAVGDVPGHEVRIFELVRTFGADAPAIGGVRVKELRSVGYSDYTDLNGPATSYNVWTMANGDKIYARTQVMAHNAAWTDPSMKGAENRTAGPITGGTGKFALLRGMMRTASHFDPRSGTNDARFDLEYWLEARH